MKKLLITLALLLGTNQVFANVSCGKGKWIEKTPKFDKKTKLVITKIRGTCTITGAGELKNLKDFYVKFVSKGPEVKKVHSNNNTDANTTVVDSTLLFKTDRGNLTARFKNVISLVGNKFSFKQVSKKIVKASGDSKHLRKLSDHFQVTKNDKGFKVVITRGVDLKVPKFAMKIVQREIMKSFTAEATAIAGDMVENL